MSHQAKNSQTTASTPQKVIEALREAIARQVDVTAKFTVDGRSARNVPSGTVTLRGMITDVTADSLVLMLSTGGTPGVLTLGPDVWGTISILAGSHEVVFFAPVLESGSPEPGSLGISVSLQLPTEIVMTHRRRSFRTAAGAADGVELRVWRIDERMMIRDVPKASLRFACELHELSAEGFGATLKAARLEAMQLQAGQRFRVELITMEAEALFEARLIHPKATARDDVSARCGFAFVNDQDSFEYRRSKAKLDTILARLQRIAAAARKSVA